MIEKQNYSNFTIVSNEILRDESLSMGARMFYTLAQSFASSWNINIKHFSKLLNVSEASVRKFRNELVDAGILSYERIKDSSGKYTQESIYSFVGFEVQEEALDSKHTKEAQSQAKDLERENQPLAQKSTSGDSAPIRINKNLKNNNSSLSAQEVILQKQTLPSAPTKLYLSALQTLKVLRDSHSKAKKPPQIELDSSFCLEEKEAFARFISYRKEKGFLAKSTIASIVREFRQLKELKADIAQCVEICINRGWSGLHHGYNASLKAQKPNFSTGAKKLFAPADFARKGQFLALEKIKLEVANSGQRSEREFTSREAR